jgi:hypothetical protein
MANDRESAETLNNILTEEGFDKIWLPENKGDEDSWGALLNENFETVTRTFIYLDDRLTIAEANTATAKNTANEANTRSLQNANSIVDINSTLGSMATDILANTNELTDARGVFSTVDERLDVSLNDDGTVKADVVMSGVYNTNYIVKAISYGSTTNSLDITTDLTGETFGDGSDYGIIGTAASSTDESDNICHVFDENNKQILTTDGNLVYGRSTNSVGDTLLLKTHYLDDAGVENTYLVTSGTTLTTYIPKVFDYYTTPQLPLINNLVVNTNKASSSEYGMVKLGECNGLDADTVDSIHANATPTANKLLPLNANARFRFEDIEVDDGISTVTNSLSTFYPKFLQTRSGDDDKIIDDYIGASGNELFVKTWASDLGGQFTRAIATVETQIDQNETDISTLDSWVTAHEAPNAHHSSTSDGLDITPASVTTDTVNCGDLNVARLHVTEYTKDISGTTEYSDRFIELNVTEVDSNPVTTSGVPVTDEYAAGIMLHTPTQDGPTLIGKAALIRYNKTTDTLELCKDWSQPSGPDDNVFHDLLGGTFTNSVMASGDIQSALNDTPQGRIMVSDGTYTGDVYVSGSCHLEGNGYTTFIDGTVYIEGTNNTITNLRADSIVLTSGTQTSKVTMSYVVSGSISDNSGETNNLLFGNY